MAHPLTPYIVVKGAAAAIDFYRAAFGAEELFRLAEPNGTIGHAHLKFGESDLMLSDEHPDFGAVGPATLGGSPIKLHLEVPDADAAAARAVEAGATLLRPVQDQFHGNRSGMVIDPFGHSWFLSAATEEVSPEEMQRRYSAMLEG